MPFNIKFLPWTYFADFGVDDIILLHERDEVTLTPLLHCRTNTHF